MMEEEPMEIIRESRRNQLLTHRKKHKNQESDVRRSLANLRISQSDVVAIINKLKTKLPITAGELQILQNAIHDNAEYTTLVLKTHGALRGLVRELSGNSVSKQCLSCGCICNMALSDDKTCLVVCSAAAAYLMTTLDSCSTQLAVSGLWAVGTLAGGCRAAGTALMAAGAAACADVIAGDRAPAALYACTHLAYTLRDELRPDFLHQMITSLSKIDISVSSAQLLFYLSCHKDFTPETIPDTYVQKLLDKLSLSMQNHVNCNTLVKTSTDNVANKCCEYVYLVRVLANMNSEILYRHLISYFLDNDLVQVLKLLLKSDSDESLFWLLGNMFNVCGGHVLFEQLVTDL